MHKLSNTERVLFIAFLFYNKKAGTSIIYADFYMHLVIAIIGFMWAVFYSWRFCISISIFLIALAWYLISVLSVRLKPPGQFLSYKEAIRGQSKPSMRCFSTTKRSSYVSNRSQAFNVLILFMTASYRGSSAHSEQRSVCFLMLIHYIPIKPSLLIVI